MRWNEHAIGFVDLEVDPDMRRQGLAKFLVSRLLGHLQDQFYSLAEIHIPSDNEPALRLVAGLGFQPVDTGWQFRKDV